MVRILALDTAFDACSVAAWENGTLAGRSQEMKRGHAEALIPMVETVLAEAGWQISRLDLIAVTHGPGAFTGLRIGLAAARGFALAARLPCMGVGTLEAIAFPVARTRVSGRSILVALESKREEIYAQLFDHHGAPLIAPVAVRLEGIAEVFSFDAGVDVVGGAAEKAAASLRAAGVDATVIDGPRFPPADAVAAMAADRWCKKRGGEALPVPLYLRPADTGPVRRAGRCV